MTLPGLTRMPALVAALLLVPLSATAALVVTLARDASTLRAQAAGLRAQNAAAQARVDALAARRQALERELAQSTGATAPAVTAQAVAPPSTPTAVSAIRGPTLAEQQATARAAIDALRTGLASSSDPSTTPPLRRDPSGPSGNVFFPELFSDPHYYALAKMERGFRDDLRYAPLYESLSGRLSTAQIAQLRETLLQRDLADLEIEGVLNAQALQEKRPRDMSIASRLKVALRRQFDAELRQAFGNAIQAELVRYADLLSARAEIIDRLELRLSYSADPLTPEQVQQLAPRVVAARQLASRNRPPGVPSVVSDELLAAVSAGLRPAQLPALQEVRTEMEGARVPGSAGSGTIRISSPVPPKK